MPRLKYSTYLGIDAGKNGGLAAIVDGSPEAVHMPVTERDVWDWFDQWNPEHGPLVAVIEKVWGHVGRNQPGSAMFNFGANYGGLRMALIAADIPFEDATPQRWQKAMGIPERKPHTKTRRVLIKKGKNKGKQRDEKYGGETDTQWKNRLKAKAQQLFPKLHVTLATADALLIALYTCRKARGLL